MFGVSMTSIMTVLLIILAICLSSGLWVLWRQRVIFKMGMRNVPRRPAQTALIIIGLMLSTLIVSAALTTGDTLNNTITGVVYDLMGHTDEVVVLSPGNKDANDTSIGANYFPQDVTEQLRNTVDKNAPIDGMMPMIFESVPAINTRNNLHEPSLILTGIDPTDVSAFGGLKDQNGNSIDVDSLPSGEIVISKTAADKLDAQVGDPITVYTNNEPHNLKIAAIADDSLMTGMVDVGSSGGFTMSLAEAQKLTGHANQISMIAISNHGGIKDGVSNTDAAVDAIDAAVANQPYRAVAIKKSAVDTAELAGNAFTSIFLVLGLFSIAAGVLLIFLIFVLLAAERKPEMGMARAVGMKRRQLTQMFLAEGIAYDLVSALVGAALGVGVAFLIVELMGRIIGGGFDITPVATWRSLVIAYSLGVIVTFFTITISSWRVSRLNIVAAIRDLPDVPKQKAGRRWLIFGILGVIVGGLLMWAGRSSGQAFAFTTGISLVPLSIAVALRRFGVPARPLYTVASLLVLAYWLAPSGWTEWMSGHLDGGMEMFFVSGIMMVAAATLAIIWNIEILTALVGFLGRTFSRWLPAVKTAIAYPSASKGRTGMTIAMFSLIIFSLVMMATINANFVQLFTTDKAGAGWDIQASQQPNNPITDFKQALAQNDVDTSKIDAVGRVEQVDGADSQVQAPGATKITTYAVNGLSTDWINNADAPLQTRATGYANDKAIWDAVRDDPTLAVIDANATASGFGTDSNSYHLSGVKSGDDTMQPTKVVVTDPATGKSQTFTIIGILDSKVSMFTGLFINADAFNSVFAKPAQINYYLQVASGVDAKTYAQAIEGGLITYGVQADSIHEQLKKASSTSQGFLYLIEGFMGLGLLVGIAALGVVSFRSVVERRQQIGMLRAIGYQRKMVSASFLIESSMITVLGVASGTILGLTLAYQLITSPDFSGTTTGITFVIPWLVIIAFIVISVGAALLMAYIPSRQAARVPIADALRYE
ncbi:MAG TPA: FtsX-like permease family protein [Nitrolancea sp.]|nr:FtsX-like permease family protein [Nitrolancea sp.]